LYRELGFAAVTTTFVKSIESP
ncbi:GNAT family N-acetyltransferase, partial [Burkholderia pseudomallei]|nr:GNAT family N-acetyltransferase [Burkholderia pseudomallei]MBF3851190.1 GNAT family N-acetyltransferase [Burkholderia pseudomallei]